MPKFRSSKANDIVKRVVGSTVPVLDGEKLSLRILVSSYLARWNTKYYL